MPPTPQTNGVTWKALTAAIATAAILFGGMAAAYTRFVPRTEFEMFADDVRGDLAEIKALIKER